MNFWARLEQFGEQPALVDDQQQSLSYAELARLADGVVADLGERRLVFLLCDSSIASVVAYLGCLRAGHVALLLEAGIDDNLLGTLISTYGPHALIRCQPDGAAIEWLNQERRVPLHPDLGLLLSTSGTTGSAKLVRLSGTNLEANADAIVQYLELSATDRPLVNLPLHYSYGLSVLNSHLAVGATLLLSGHTVMQREFWQRVKAERASSLAGVPYSFEMMDRLRFERMELPSLKTLTQAGGRLSPRLVEKFARLGEAKGFRLFVMYGQTEAAPRIAYLPPELAALRPDCIGRPIPGGRWWLESPNGEAITASGQEGELVYQGDNVMLGYAERQADLGLGDLNAGVLHTGDLAVLDAQGMATITGRLKRIVKVFGNRVSLDDLERFLQEQHVTGHCLGEDDRILVVIGEPCDEEAVAQSIIDRFSFHHSVIQTRVVDSIPYLASGKVDYRTLALPRKD